MTTLKFSLLALSIVVFGCSSGDKTSVEEDAFAKKINKSAEELHQEILRLDSSLIQAESLNSMLFIAEEQLLLSEAYLEKFEQDPLKPSILLKAANACRALNKSEQAVKYLNTFLKEFPEDAKGDEALFTKAFILDEDLKKKPKAEEAYKQLLKDYPDSPLRTNAEILLEQLYMSDAELIESFRKKNQEQ